MGNVTDITDEAGNIVENYEYDAYGNAVIRAPSGELRDTSVVGNCYMFTGREFDAETGLYYYRARYYSPKLGRFITPDPLGMVDGTNLYTYCFNNPVNWVDPFGLGASGGGEGGDKGGTEIDGQKKPPGKDKKWDPKKGRWVDDDFVYTWDERVHGKRGNAPHWDRGPKDGGKGEWSPDGYHWYPK